MSRFGCTNYSGDDNDGCDDRFTCNHCQYLEALHELADHQRRLIELLKEKLA